MALSDDVLDRAIDAAEAKLSKAPEADDVQEILETDDAEVSLDKNEGEKPSDPEEGATEKEAKGPAKKAAKADKVSAERERDENGRFKEKEKDLNDQEASAEEVVQEPQVEVPVEVPAIEPPAFWSTERKALFAKAPPELQQVIAQRELELQQLVSRTANEANGAKEFQKRLYSDLGNDPQKIQLHKAELQLNGIRDEVEELHNYRAWNQIFKSDVKSGILDLMYKNGLSVEDLTSETQNYQHNSSVAAVEQAKAEAQKVREELENFKKSQEETQLRTEVEYFKSGKDSRGQTRKAFAEMYAPQISMAVDAIAQANPGMSRMDALNHAYEFTLQEVTKLFPNVNTASIQQPKSNGVSPQKAKAAASSVTGAPSNGVPATRTKAKSIDEALDRAEEQLGLR